MTENAIVAWGIATSLVGITVVIHYETLGIVNDRILPKLGVTGRRAVVCVMLGMLLAHVAEIWVYALAMMVMVESLGMGGFAGMEMKTLNDYLYFSSVTYTSLGYGDVVPTGAIRQIAASQTLVGLVMIGWTASITYLEMRRMWDEAHPGHRLRHPGE